MNLEKIFTDPNSIKIWQSYFKRVEKQIRVLDNELKKETILELQDHLYQSFKEENGEDEVSCLLTAAEKLGQPEEFLKSVVSSKLLEKGTQTLSPKILLTGLFYKLWGGIGNVFTALFLVLVTL